VEARLTIGEALAQARRQAGVTVTQVGQRTRIRETIIRDIENDDYSSCGGDFYARGHIRSIGRAVGIDPEPLIRQFDMARQHELEEQQAEQQAQAAPAAAAGPWSIAETGEAGDKRRLNRVAALGLALLLVLGFLAYHFFGESVRAPSAALRAPVHPAHRHAPHPAPAATPTATSAPTPSATPTPTPKRSPAPAVTARPLTPVAVTALGPHGQGDDPGHARLAIDGSSGTAWHTDWYTTAHFGNLYSGTGLLVDMGRPVTITAAQVTLGRAAGARLQLRVGAAPALADLKPVMSTGSGGGQVSMRLGRPARGRYVLLWFTSLPPDANGTFQASVYNLRLEGQE
jgi:cytoskeletal protein RodZ